MIKFTLEIEKLIGRLNLDDIQVDKDILEKAKTGDGDSLSRIGDIYYINGDYKKAMDWYRWDDSCNSSHSQFSLVYMYFHGKGVCIDDEEAMKWYLKAHKNGHVMATQNIGFSYDTGSGVKRDCKTAFKWLLKAARKGHAPSQYSVGLYYEEGRGVDKNMLCALKWYQKSAEKEYKEAEKQLKRLNDQWVHLDDKQKKIYHLEKDVMEHTLKIKALEKKQRKAKEAKQAVVTLELPIEIMEKLKITTE